MDKKTSMFQIHRPSLPRVIPSRGVEPARRSVELIAGEFETVARLLERDFREREIIIRGEREFFDYFPRNHARLPVGIASRSMAQF
nr:unnamed protein product [Callosobruchus chinensis]